MIVHISSIYVEADKYTPEHQGINRQKTHPIYSKSILMNPPYVSKGTCVYIQSAFIVSIHAGGLILSSHNHETRVLEHWSQLQT